MIAFTSAIAWLGVDQFGKRENFNEDAMSTRCAPTAPIFGG